MILLPLCTTFPPRCTAIAMCRSTHQAFFLHWASCRNRLAIKLDWVDWLIDYITNQGQIALRLSYCRILQSVYNLIRRYIISEDLVETITAYLELWEAELKGPCQCRLGPIDIPMPPANFILYLYTSVANLILIVANGGMVYRRQYRSTTAILSRVLGL